MGERLGNPLPIWHLQYQLLGGHRRMFTVLVAASMVFAVGIFGTYRLVQEPFNIVGPWFLMALSGFQLFVIALAGCNAIYRAMLRDYDSKMIESHRLTPLSNLTVVLGYLFGATQQTIALFLVIVVTGVLVSLGAGLPADSWVYGNLCALSGTIMLWSACVFWGLRQEKPSSPAPILIGFAVLSFPIGVIPALGLLTGLYSGYLGIWMMNGTVPVPPIAVYIVVAVSAFCTVFWVSTAAVKYRRPDLPALNGGRGLVLVGLTTLLGTAGIVAFERIVPGSAGMGGFYERYFPRMQWVVTLIGELLLAGVAIAGASKCRVLAARGTALRGASDRVSPLSVAVLASLLVCTLMAAVGSPLWPRFLDGVRSDQLRENLVICGPVWGWTLGACLLGALTLCGLFAIAYRRFATPKYFVIMFLIFAWALPPIGDSIRMEFVREHGAPADYSWLIGCCPPGLIAAVWVPLDIRLWPGALVQSGVLIVLAWFARRARIRDESRIQAKLGNAASS